MAGMVAYPILISMAMPIFILTIVAVQKTESVDMVLRSVEMVIVHRIATPKLCADLIAKGGIPSAA